MTRRATPRKKNAQYGAPLNIPAPLISRYRAEWQKLFAEMIKTTEREVTALFEGRVATEFFAEDASITSKAETLTDALIKRFSQLFDDKAFPMAVKMVNGANKSSATHLKGSLKDLSANVTLAPEKLTGVMRESMKAMVQENVSLIKSISDEYLKRVQQAVMRSITTGSGMQSILPALKKSGEITERHAELVAMDQTRKAYNGMNKLRMEKVGIKKFEWLHTGGSQHPRKEHQEMSGNIYSFDNLPVIDSKTGERGIPGQLPYCRCRMVPVIEFDE
jgi:SPP1 gp7 family putative phage head morphogenesis protein